MLKVGIITHYFKSTNYGGNLQAYALCKFLNSHGFSAVQISYDRTYDSSAPASLIGKLKRKLRKTQKSIKNTPNKIKTLAVNKIIRERKNAVLCFNQSIPHTETYTAENISSITEKFDVFITGSDQVWNPLAVCSAYLLDFATQKDAFKLSYAASISANELPAHIIERYKNSLESYFAVSVRENQAVTILQPYVQKKIEVVLDPTLLLDFDEWDKMKKNSTIKERYVFCYFLEGSEGQRDIAEKFAKEHNLKIVTIPYLNGSYRKCDKHFGDIKLSDVSPEEFIGLVSGSEYVFTDSFHATVFSVLFKKQFFVFDRIIKQSLGSRIKDLTDLFDLEERFCNTDERANLKYIGSLKPIDYSKSFVKYENAKSFSESFLLENLNKIKESTEK